MSGTRRATWRGSSGTFDAAERDEDGAALDRVGNLREDGRTGDFLRGLGNFRGKTVEGYRNPDVGRPYAEDAIACLSLWAMSLVSLLASHDTSGEEMIPGFTYSRVQTNTARNGSEQKGTSPKKKR